MDGEDPAEFNDLLEAFNDEYTPVEVSEEAAVFDLAALHWKKRRLEAGLQQALNMRRASRVANASGGGWDKAAGVARDLAKLQLQAKQHACEKIFKTMTEVVSKPDPAIDNIAAAEIKRQAEWIKGLNLEEFSLAVLRIAEKEMHDQIDQAYNADIIERGLKIGAEFDRQIDKAVKRLVMIKEFKRLYVPKSVDSKPAQIEVLPTKPVGGETGIEVDAGAPVIT